MRSNIQQSLYLNLGSDSIRIGAVVERLSRKSVRSLEVLSSPLPTQPKVVDKSQGFPISLTEER